MAGDTDQKESHDVKLSSRAYEVLQHFADEAELDHSDSIVMLDKLNDERFLLINYLHKNAPGILHDFLKYRDQNYPAAFAFSPKPKKPS